MYDEINPWGNRINGGWIITSADDHSKAAIAHNPLDNTLFLARTGVWPYYDLYGHFLDYTSEDFFNPDQFIISDAPGAQAYPIITRDSVNGRFLVTWLDDRNIDGAAIYGQLVSAEGQLEGSEFEIVGGLSREYSGWGDGSPHYSVAYDHVNQRFLVVWNPGASISGQFLNANGTLQGEQITIVENPDDFYPIVHTAVAYDAINQRYLVIADLYWGLGEIIGQLVNADGTPSGTSFTIPWNGRNPSVAFDNVNQRYLVAWTWGYTDGQFVNPDGTLQGDGFSISHIGTTPYYYDDPPAIAFNSECGNFLVASVSKIDSGMEDLWAINSEINYTIVGDPCPSATLTVKMKGYGGKRKHISGTGMNCIRNICSGQYWPGSEIGIDAYVDDKEVLVTWTGCDAIDSYSSCHITMDSDKNVTAKFTRAPRRKR